MKDYFDVHGKKWIEENYSNLNMNNYPVGYHRMRIVEKVIDSYYKSHSHFIDLGCGGGNVSVLLAKKGHRVTALDRSQVMLDQARDLAKKERVKSHINFRLFDIEKNQRIGKCDAMLALGFIGYIDCPSTLFRIASESIDHGGLFIISSRNVLFNIFSPTFRTIKTFQDPDLCEKVIKEIQHLLKKSVIMKDTEFNIPNLSLKFTESKDPFEIPMDGEVEAKQYLPSELDRLAMQNGFKINKTFGVHPHLLSPLISRFLQDKSKNEIDNVLLPFEEDSISLIWSSVFISVFRRM
jgi:2-polyprenyl-3-methyl-5-hydroxy-6-metoxy-1,4-benzoquinol methylase